MTSRRILFLVPIAEIGSLKLLLFIAESVVKHGGVPFLITQEEGPLTKEFTKIGGKVFILKLPAWRKGKNFIKRYFTVAKISRIIRENKINLIHCFSWRVAPYAICSSRQTRVPHFIHVHDFMDKKHIFRFLLHKADFIITPSDYVGNCFKGLRPKVFRVPNGIEIDKFRRAQKGKLRREFALGNDTVLVGMVGYFTPWKGQDVFIEACAFVKKQYPKVKFVIVGDNIWKTAVTKESLQELAKAKGVLEDVIFTGARSDIPDVLADFDIFVLPSQNESFGLSIIEAMAANCPVITHKFAGGPSEIIEDGKDGLLVDCRNLEELSGAIIKLIREPDLRRNLAEAAIKKVNAKFDIAHFLSEIEHVYQASQPGKRFLVINPFGIGDVLFTTPLINSVRLEYPRAHISYWCNERVAPILTHNQCVDKIFALSRGDIKKIFAKSKIEGVRQFLKLVGDLRKEKFDICFDFSLDYRYGLIAKLIGVKTRIGYNFKNRGRFLTHKKDIDGYNSQHIVEYYLKLLDFLNVKPKAKNIQLRTSSGAFAKVENFFSQLGVRKEDFLVGIAPGAGLSWGKDAYLKHWPAKHFAELADCLIENQKVKIVIFGDGLERDIADIIVHHMRNKPIDLVGKLKLADFIDLLSRCNILVANDGGPLHMGVGLGLKTVSLFGPVDDLVYGPYPPGEKHIVVKKDLACRPCYRNFRTAVCSAERACIQEISVDEVYSAVTRLIK